jgi:hypothetical protein
MKSKLIILGLITAAIDSVVAKKEIYSPIQMWFLNLLQFQLHFFCNHITANLMKEEEPVVSDV